MRVHRQVAGVLAAELGFGRAVFQEVAGHPVVFAGAGEALDGFAEIPAVQFRAAFARGADERHGEARLEGERDERGLAVARHAFDADLLRVHGGIGFKAVQSARRAPGPGAERTPVVRLARLALVDEADDALGQARAVVGLNAVGIDRGIAPAGGDEQLGRGRAGVRAATKAAERAEAIRGRGFARAPGKAVSAEAAAEHHQHGHRPLGVCGRDEGHLNVHFDGRTGGIVHMPDPLLRGNRHGADNAVRRLRHDRPRHLRNIFRHAAEDLALEVLDDFRAAHLPPLLGGGDLLAVLRHQRIGQVGEGIGLGGVVIGRVGRAGVAARAGAQPGDAQLLHHVFVILLRRPVQWLGSLRAENRRGRRGERRREAGETDGTRTHQMLHKHLDAW